MTHPSMAPHSARFRWGRSRKRSRPASWSEGGFRFRQRRLQPRSGPCGWRPSRVSPPPPPPYCLCEEGRAAAAAAASTTGTVGAARRGRWGVRVGPGWGSGARPPLTLPADSRAALRLPLPPPPDTHTSRGSCSPSGRPWATPQGGE